MPTNTQSEDSLWDELDTQYLGVVTMFGLAFMTAYTYFEYGAAEATGMAYTGMLLYLAIMLAEVVPLVGAGLLQVIRNWRSSEVSA